MPTEFLDLPTELLQYIIIFSQYDDVKNLGCACHRLALICSDPTTRARHVEYWKTTTVRYHHDHVDAIIETPGAHLVCELKSNLQNSAELFYEAYMFLLRHERYFDFCQRVVDRQHSCSNFNDVSFKKKAEGFHDNLDGQFYRATLTNEPYYWLNYQDYDGLGFVDFTDWRKFVSPDDWFEMIYSSSDTLEPLYSFQQENLKCLPLAAYRHFLERSKTLHPLIEDARKTVLRSESLILRDLDKIGARAAKFVYQHRTLTIVRCKRFRHLNAAEIFNPQFVPRMGTRKVIAGSIQRYCFTPLDDIERQRLLKKEKGPKLCTIQ